MVTTGPESRVFTTSGFYIEKEEDIREAEANGYLLVIEGFGVVHTTPKDMKLQISDIDSDSGLISFDYKGQLGSDYLLNKKLCFVSDRIFLTVDTDGSGGPRSGGSLQGVGTDRDGPDKSLFYVGDGSALPTDFGDNSTRIKYTKFYRGNYSDKLEPVESKDMAPRNSEYLRIQDKICSDLKTLIDPEIKIQERTSELAPTPDIKNPDTLFSKFIRFDKL